MLHITKPTEPPAHVCTRENFEVQDMSMRKGRPNEMGMWLPQLIKIKLIKEGILVTSRVWRGGRLTGARLPTQVKLLSSRGPPLPNHAWAPPKN